MSLMTCGGAGLFQEKPHSLQNNIRTSLEKKKRGSGVSWASRPEATPQGKWGMCSGWGGGSGGSCLMLGCGGPVEIDDIHSLGLLGEQQSVFLGSLRRGWVVCGGVTSGPLLPAPQPGSGALGTRRAPDPP